MSRTHSELYEFGGFRLDVDEHKLSRIDGAADTPLPEKAFQTLVILVRNHGRLLTKSEILDAVWPDISVEENNLDKAIHAIRHALGERSSEQKFIETVRKHGYRFIAEVRSVDAILPRSEEVVPFAGSAVLAAAADIAEPSESQAAAGSGQSSRYWSIAAAALGLLGILVVGGWFLTKGEKGGRFPGAGINSTNAVTDENARSPAYDLYVRGKVKVGSENREDTEAAIHLLEEAIAADPDFAEAHAQLARGYNTMAFKYASGAERKRFNENAEVSIEKALALNPDLAEAHFARGLIIWTSLKRFPHEQAIRSYQRSIALNPNLDETHHQLALVYSHIGLLDQAEQSLQRAIEINPNNTLARFRRGVNIAYRGKAADAVAVYKTVPSEFTPLLVDRSTAEALIQIGHLDEAAAIVDRYLDRFPQDEGGSFTSVKALVLAKSGKKKEAEDAILRALEIGKGFGHFHHTTYNAASTYAALGMPDEAIKWLEFTAEDGFPNYQYFEVDPNLDSLRGHPGFQRLMATLKAQNEQFRALG